RRERRRRTAGEEYKKDHAGDERDAEAFDARDAALTAPDEAREECPEHEKRRARADTRMEDLQELRAELEVCHKAKQEPDHDREEADPETGLAVIFARETEEALFFFDMRKRAEVRDVRNRYEGRKREEVRDREQPAGRLDDVR